MASSRINPPLDTVNESQYNEDGLQQVEVILYSEMGKGSLNKSLGPVGSAYILCGQETLVTQPKQ